MRYEGICWNADTGLYETVESLRNRAHFKKAFERHFRRQTQTRVIDIYLAIERKETQKKYCSAHAATSHLMQTGLCHQCGKGNCPICAIEYASVLRTYEGYETIGTARKNMVKRRFDKFIDGGDEQTKAKRVRSLFKPEKKRDLCTNLSTIFE
jgi:ferredoxin